MILRGGENAMGAPRWQPKILRFRKGSTVRGAARRPTAAAAAAPAPASEPAAMTKREKAPKGSFWARHKGKMIAGGVVGLILLVLAGRRKKTGSPLGTRGAAA